MSMQKCTRVAAAAAARVDAGGDYDNSRLLDSRRRGGFAPPRGIRAAAGDSRRRGGFAPPRRIRRPLPRRQARAELPRTSQRPFAPCEKVDIMQVTPSSGDAFVSGLRNIRQAIESRLKACGIENLSLG